MEDHSDIDVPPIIDVHCFHWPSRLSHIAKSGALLSAGERDQAARYRFDKDRWRFTLCRAWLRRLLGARLGQSPSGIKFHAGEYGKPHIEGKLEFNLSHSGEWAVCAIAENLPVGIDIEVYRPFPEAKAIAGEFFTPGERSLLECAGEEETAKRFLRLWTRKEAYVKAVGHGLSMALNQFTVGLDDDSVLNESQQRWGMRSLSVVPDHAVALCAPGRWDWRHHPPETAAGNGT